MVEFYVEILLMSNRFYFSISFDLIIRTIVEILWLINSLLNYPLKEERKTLISLLIN